MLVSVVEPSGNLNLGALQVDEASHSSLLSKLSRVPAGACLHLPSCGVLQTNTGADEHRAVIFGPVPLQSKVPCRQPESQNCAMSSGGHGLLSVLLAAVTHDAQSLHDVLAAF